jgi:GMP synthase (glutamine-hydrolysing)
MSAPTLLLVQHEDCSPPARLGDLLAAQGFSLDLRRPYGHHADPLPQPSALREYAGIVVLGGSMDSWDDEASPWLPAVRTLIRGAEDAGVPLLGICLGHQLAASALGGRVGRNPAGPTLAVLPVGCTAEVAGDPLATSLRGAVGVHWNNDVVTDLPPGAMVLARSPDGAVQAARWGRHVWGVQYHPEADPPLVDAWVTGEGGPYAATVDLAGLSAQAWRHQADLARSCHRLATAFARLAVEVRR